jgi:UPF0755 protein
VVIIASMIEKEAKFDGDRAKIARVIFNRLGGHIPLGIDATLAYGLKKSGAALTSADLTSSSPYNTRIVKGLPPTPIASPGLASLQAALNPATGNWIYYVRSDAAGHHLFTADAQAFEAAKKKCADNKWGCGA